MKILIIEDEIITATDLKNILEKKGHSVLPICRNYHDALKVLEKATPDLLLVDIRLRHSSLDGIGIASEIYALHAIPIIYLTSQTDHETFERARPTQPAAYLFKPFRKEELVFQIELAYEHYKINKAVSPDPCFSKSVFFPCKEGHQKIHKQHVRYIKAEGAYARIYTTREQAPLMLSMNIGYVAQFFAAPNFFKLGRSYIVNLDRIEKFDTEHIYFEGSEEIVPIPQTHRKELLKRIALAKTPQR